MPLVISGWPSWLSPLGWGMLVRPFGDERWWVLALPVIGAAACVTVAFALAAILSPTDPIAVSAIAQRVPIPKRLMHILDERRQVVDCDAVIADMGCNDIGGKR